MMSYKKQNSVLFLILMYFSVSKTFRAEDFMVMDAIEGTTPAVCTPGMTCGFQQYDDENGVYFYYPFLRYCHCPEEYGCIEEGQNMRRQFFYYTCKDVKEHLQPHFDGIEGTSTVSTIYRK